MAKTWRTRASTKVVEYMGATLTSDDFISSCAPWGAMCVTLGTKYVPIGLPSVIGSVFLLAPMVWAFKEVRARDKEIFRLRERLGTNADEDA
ncbi:unnamed product [Ostreococcus tauri]|uniref:Unnamed product n=1 Tax=Ostreococcus tauri TaxID=70448 RepID=A0A090N4T3_OSTTA|nr:unnamed product [Ostreococcus tauri]CEG01356.1 unnamed product [Ostreococcus tauri]|eukprot:XP_022840907.1 unnamed product [Ostreococcus tauri]